MSEREKQLFEVARFRARLLGDRVREMNKWDAGYSLRKGAWTGRRVA
jgi:hypothetical protein